MEKVVFVGEHPYSHTGNGNMMRAILNQVDFSRFQVTVYSCTKADIPPFETTPYTIIVNPGDTPEDQYGMKKMANMIANMDFDIFLVVGIDIWRLAPVIDFISLLKRKKGFVSGGIIPYDLHTIREDWLKWISSLDFPCVYSEYGYQLLQPRLSKIRYYRPPLNGHEIFRPFEEGERERVRRDLFHTLPPEAILVGFVGPNQVRKDPQRLLKAFFEVKQEVPNLYLYMHTQFVKGVYNLQQTAMDYGARAGDIILMNQRSVYTRDKMVDLYNSMDLYVLPSLQEGLSWTVLEAMLCGVPVIASDSTAHKELLGDGVGHLIHCSDLAYVPMVTERGPSWLESRACSLGELREAIYILSTNEEGRKEFSQRGLIKAREWLEGVDNINGLLIDMTKRKTEGIKKRPEVLFVQHSSAGDVLMSTQCFQGIKERHTAKPLIYMTQPMYQDIVQGNPHIDRIIDYDDGVLEEYEIIYNPHGDRILPGGFNNLDVKLHSMYPYFCKVEPGDIFIEPVNPEIELPKEYIVVHTTGGQGDYRGYRHMDMAVREIGLPVIQIGGYTDIACHEAALDLRGKLTWRETAWVMNGAKAAVVIDSFPSHLAGALGTPVVVLYGPAPARVTGPRGDEKKIINLEPNKLDVCPNLTNCWGNPAGTKKCTSPCINTISPMRIRKALKELLGSEQQEKLLTLPGSSLIKG